MNRKMLNEHLAQSPNFLIDECIHISIKHIDVDKCSQTRASTEVQSHIDNLAQSMIDSGRQEVPVTVEEYVTNKGKTRFMLRDGNHRFGAIVKNSQHQNEGIRLKFQNILAYKCKFETIESREEYQWKMNDHDLALTNTDADAVHLMNQRMKRDAIKDANGNPITPENYQAAQSNADVLTSSLESLGVAKSSIPSVLSRVEKTTYNGQVKTWNASTVTRAYRDSDYSNWEGSKPGEVDEEEVLFHLNNTTRISPNLTGAILRRLVKDQEANEGAGKPRTKVSVAAWLGDCVHKSGTAVDNYRKDVVKEINTLNKVMTKMGLGPMITGELVFMPQKLATKKESKCIPKNIVTKAPDFAKRAEKVDKTIKDNKGNKVTFEAFKL